LATDQASTHPKTGAESTATIATQTLIVAAAPKARAPVQESFLSLNLAGPWRRLYARGIDTLLFGWPVWLIMFAMIANGSVSLRVWAGQPSSGYVIGWLSTPLILAAEAMLFGIFGNTPGKALLGIQVVNDLGQRLNFKRYASRLVRLYSYGLATGIPFVSLITMGIQYKRLAQGGHASYDEGQSSVRGKPLTPHRVTLIVFVSLLLPFIQGLFINAINAA
jgi:uncharacterized RDD family membrane protein YckC